MSMKQILGAIRKADLDYDLIDDGDRICVGVSGGKDSMVLLYAMKLYERIALRYDNKHFTTVGVHLDMGFGGMDFTEVIDFCKKHEIEYYDVPTKIYEILKLHPKKNGEIQCSLCSKLKKGAIVQEAKNYNCNKVAFAHHADDAIETLLLNMVYGARIKTFEPAMHLSKQQMDFIRPFVYCFESDIAHVVNKELDIPVVKSTCPNDGFTKRQDVKELLHSIYHTYPNSKENFLKALSNTEQTGLWVKHEDWRNRK